MSIIVGSNIYNVEFVEDIFVYYGSPINDTDTIPYEENLFISKIKLDMPEYKFSRSERINIVLSIIRNGLHLIEYPIINDCTIMNTFELQYQNNLKSYPTLNFTKSERDQLSIILDVRKSYFSIQNCYQILESINSEPSQFFRNKYVLLRYPQKQMIVKIKSVIYDQEFTYKNMSLEEHFRTKYQLQSKHQVYLETYNTKNIKKQFLFAEFCDLQVDYIEQNITKYCEQLDYWNRILNNSSLFMNHLKNFKLIIQAYNVEYKQQYLEPGIMVFNNIQKSVQMMIGTRTTNEFEYYYGDFFLKDKTIFTTSLQINKLLIFVTRELIESREHFKSFLDQLDLQIKSRQYKIGQPKIFDVYHNLNDLITQYVTDDSYVLFVGDQCLEFQTARIELLKRGIPNQIILQPIQDQEVNRLLGKMTANIGSVPWSIKEITGYIGNKKTAVLGIQKIDDNNISACLSINKYLNKYISSFGETNQTIRMLLATYYATHKIFPEQLIIFSEEQFNQLIEQKILEIIQMIREQQLASQILKPEIISVIVKDAQQERYFTYHEKQFEPYYCRNPQIGIIIPIDEKNGKFTIHTQRGESGCIRAQSINISGNNYREILQLYYSLIFLNFDLSASSYLPAPLHYAKKLTRFQIDSSVYKKAIEKGLMLYV